MPKAAGSRSASTPSSATTTSTRSGRAGSDTSVSEPKFETLDVEAEVDHVAVAHDVLLALQPERPLLAAGGQRPRGHEVVEGHHLRADEPPLDVGVDGARRHLRLGAPADGP